jgi:hypothetical protein
MLIEAVSRDRVLLVSDLPAGPQPRQYHPLDAYSLGLYLALSRIASRQTDYPSEVNQALVSETAHLILGEAMPAQERRTRQTEFRVARGATIRKGGAAKSRNDKFIRTLFESRRQELQGNVFAAAPYVWHRSADLNFVTFLNRDCTLATGLFDRTLPGGGMLDGEFFAAQGFTSFLNLTRALTTLDEELTRVVAARV